MNANANSSAGYIMRPGHILILGGARSGKTGLGESLALQLGESPAYLATADMLDDEMRERVAAHQRKRHLTFTTIEESLELCDAIAEALRHDVILVDCLTLWITNLLGAGRDVAGEVESLAELLEEATATRLILISNEVGLGIVPDNALARSFRDLAGWTHQRLAQTCTHVYFTAAGLPMVLKGDNPG